MLCGCHSGKPAGSIEKNAKEAVAPAVQSTSLKKTELLARHQTIATFEGVEYQLCKGRTSLCPKECGNSGEFATFKIDKYQNYKSYSPYGEQQKSFTIQISDYDKKPVGDKALNQTIAGLKKGDKVYLDWTHLYVSENGVSAPQYPVMRLENMPTQSAK